MPARADATDVAAPVAGLARGRVVVGSRDGDVRIPPHWYNTAEDVDAVLAGLHASRSPLRGSASHLSGGLVSLLADLVTAVGSGAVEVIDLTAPLSSSTPILQLPPPFGNTDRFELREISRYDDRGPAWYWNNITTGEHTGTHFDAPNHWVTGRDRIDVSQVPPVQLVAPAVVLDHSAESAADPDFLLEIEHVQAWEAAHGPLPDGGWLLHRTGWDARADSQEAALNVTDTGPHSPGVSVECARWLAESTPILGLGTETVGTDAGAAHSFPTPFPCHSFLLGAGKYGLTSLRNLDRLPPTGAVLVATPLPIVGGSGSPARVLALVER